MTPHQEAQDLVHNTEIDLIHITQRFITSIIKNEKKITEHMLSPALPLAAPALGRVRRRRRLAEPHLRPSWRQLAGPRPRRAVPRLLACPRRRVPGCARRQLAGLPRRTLVPAGAGPAAAPGGSPTSTSAGEGAEGPRASVEGRS